MVVFLPALCAFWGSKKARAIKLSQNANTRQWDARIWLLVLDDETGGVKGELSWVGVFPTEKKALAAAKKTTAKRNRGELEALPPKDFEPPETHLQILVVSSRFSYLSAIERVALVYERLLLPALFEPVSPAPWQGRASTWKGFGTVGWHVLNEYPVFKHLNNGIQFNVIAKTPSQWDPARFEPAISERMGASPQYCGRPCSICAGKVWRQGCRCDGERAYSR